MSRGRKPRGRGSTGLGGDGLKRGRQLNPNSRRSCGGASTEGSPKGGPLRCPSSRTTRRSQPAAHQVTVLNAAAGVLPELVGGSADLAPSNKTYIAEGGDVQATSLGHRNLHFGIREHAMGAMLNGMSLHGGMRPFGGTFLVFSDYMRPAIRLAALMEQPVIYVFTHDSVWVGEDGPTHQPIEHLMALRAIPGLVVLRPCRCQRDCCRMGGGPRAYDRADCPSAQPAGTAGAGRSA